MKSKRAVITWPVAVVLCAFIAAVAATLILMPPETASLALGGEGLLAVGIAAYLRSPRDTAVGE